MFNPNILESDIIRVTARVSNNGNSVQHFMKELEKLPPETNSESRPNFENTAWMSMVKEFCNSVEASDKQIEVSNGDKSGHIMEFIRCSWMMKDADQRWFDLTVSRSNSYFELNINVSRENDPISIYCGTISTIKLRSDGYTDFMQFISERTDMKPNFEMELYRSGEFRVIAS